MKRLLWVVLVVAGAGCKRRESRPVPVQPPSDLEKQAFGQTPGSGIVGVAKPTVSRKPEWIVGTKPSAFKKPTRERNPSEEILYGTWVARVGDHSTKSAFMSDRVVFSVNAKPGQDAVGAIMDALEKDNKLTTNCIWLELNPDFTGIRRECMVVNGEPSALDQTDPMSGAKKDLGTTLEWYFDLDAKPAQVKIHFLDDMVAPIAKNGKLETIVFRDWNLAMGTKVGDNKFEVTETFPEHADYRLPTTYAYELFPQRFLGK